MGQHCLSTKKPKETQSKYPQNQTENIKTNHENEEKNETKERKIQEAERKKKENQNKEEEVMETILERNDLLEDKDLILHSINNCEILSTLDDKARMDFISKMSLCKVKSGDFIFKEGNNGNYFYVIRTGKVKLFLKGELKKILSQGDFFGEKALIYGGERTASIQADNEVIVWCIERTVFKQIVDYYTAQVFEENKRFIQSIPMLNILPNEQKCLLYNNLISHTYFEGEYIVKKGEKATCLYIIKRGEANCINDEGVVITVKKQGEFFGERSILIDSTRTLNVTAKTDCICYSVSIETLKIILGDKFRDVLFLNFIKLAFQKSKYFNQINTKLIEHIYPFFKVRNYGYLEPVLRKGYLVTQRIIILVEGTMVKSSNINSKICEKGEILFEENVFLKVKQKTIEDVVAKPDCLLLHVNVKEFNNVLGGSFSQIMFKSQIINTFYKVHLFKNMTQTKLEAISSHVEVKSYKSGEDIVKEGEEGKELFIVKSGVIDIFIKGEWKRSFNVNDFFGERALLLKEPRSATAKAKGDVECYILSKLKFLPYLEENLKKYLIQRIHLQDSSVQLKDLYYQGVLGDGSYGDVCLVESKITRHQFAIKSVNKKLIDMERLHENVEMERDILLKIDHPFIIKLVKIMKDEKRVYFLMEYIKGKDLFEIIREIGILSKYQIQFYSASMLLSINYLHQNKYIFRDIKPENILVADTGYMKLIDFGTAKEIQDRTSTVIGTPHYMAPEIVKGEGYSFIVDFWSIGICMFEFAFGYVPFGDSEEDPLEIYILVSNEELMIPKECKDKDLKDLLMKLLVKLPNKRLCNFSKIVNHQYYKNFSFDELIDMNLPPAHVLTSLKEHPRVLNTLYTTYKGKQKEINSQSDPVTREEQVIFDRWFENFK